MVRVAVLEPLMRGHNSLHFIAHRPHPRTVMAGLVPAIDLKSFNNSPQL
jgi:hypothetical protein